MTRQEFESLKNSNTNEIIGLKSIVDKTDKDLLELTFKNNARLLLNFKDSAIIEFAEHLGVSRVYIHYLLSGRYKIYNYKKLFISQE